MITAVGERKEKKTNEAFCGVGSALLFPARDHISSTNKLGIKEKKHNPFWF